MLPTSSLPTNSAQNRDADPTRVLIPPPTPGSRAKRLYDISFSAFGLLILGPVFLMTGAIIRIIDGGNVFYRQTRIGLGGRPFSLYKFRTMVSGADQAGPGVTKDGDARITRIGRFLRKTKLDELPQLWNVLKGDMSLVGPRPEVPRYVERYTPEQRLILRDKPGITDLASLSFRNEEDLLRHADNVEEFYVRHCIPRKLALNQQYAERATVLNDTWIILQTICPYWISVMCLYGLILVASFGLACELTYNFTAPPSLLENFLRQGIFVTLVQLLFLAWRKQYKGLLSYFSIPELQQTGTALGLAWLVLTGLSWISNEHWHLPMNLLLIDFIVALFMLSLFRLALRRWRERALPKGDLQDHPPLRVGIIGAGNTGAQVARELMTRRTFGRTVAAFFDDDHQKWQKRLHDIPVVGMPECLLEGWSEKLDEVIIAMPEAAPERIKEIFHVLQESSLKFYHAPSLSEFCKS